MISEWIWATDIPQTVAGTRAIIHIGHARWRIENNGFNELVNEWNADHVYKHEPHAMLVIPQLRARHTTRHFAKLVAAEFYIPFGDRFT